MPINAVLNLINTHHVEFIDLRFTDMNGKEHHTTIPSRIVSPEWFSTGHPFDGSSLLGWKGIQASDMLLMPDPATAHLDPFFTAPTLILTCDVVEPTTGQGYDRDPRTIAKRAEAYLAQSQLADTAYFGPEPEFFIFDAISWGVDMNGCHVTIDSDEGHWASQQRSPANKGHRPGIKGGYMPVPPVDSLHNLRASMVQLLEQAGIPVEVFHHEVATGGQCEIGTRYSTLTQRADWTQTLKYIVHNVAHQHGKTATFMPKPIVGDNGSGMHVHQSLWQHGRNLFSGPDYAGLSEMALFYIGGIIKHAKALNAITNPSTNSYKRLVPHFEAPVKLAYSAKNRSAAIRIPFSTGENAKRVEVRFPDPLANPYLAFAALLMAGLDGIKHRIHPGDAADKNLYDLSAAEDAQIPTVCASLEEALAALQADHAFLLEGGVFTPDFIQAYIQLKQRDVDQLRMTTHPVEFAMYYSL